MIVAIDGPVGVGKSTIARMIAKEAHLYYLNSGNFYRAITLKHLERKGDFSDRASCIKTAQETHIDIKDGVFYVDSIPVTEGELHNARIDMNSSRISAIPEVRSIVDKRIVEIASGMDIIAEGRDMTTVVFPDADFKFYLDASPEIRAKRRFDQKLDGLSYEEVLESLRKRDENDRNKAVGALKIAPNATIIDTSYLTIKEVCEKVLRAVKRQEKL
ncbi:MAG: (d)CMP kinase [Sphaerochaetaceae bacterium]|jgi:cytidylate kinase|nr:(d)CMP kinase [Sphaerochaetaceae bacterium]MDD3164168.1 (d)CMP kinase [Sphaerochaetaceae bacterium]MDD4006728.1 (d)CMP kinase [Sphaerochaetaceae bacterium]MDD4396789.1 (d)CMP kinase [Sphaerochaetaceae bacterium]